MLIDEIEISVNPLLEYNKTIIKIGPLTGV